MSDEVECSAIWIYLKCWDCLRSGHTFVNCMDDIGNWRCWTGVATRVLLVLIIYGTVTLEVAFQGQIYHQFNNSFEIRIVLSTIRKLVVRSQRISWY